MNKILIFVSLALLVAIPTAFAATQTAFYNGFEDSSGIGHNGFNTNVWSVEYGSSNNKANITNYNHTGSYSAIMGDGNSGNVSISIKSGFLNTSNYNNCNLSFWHVLTDNWVNNTDHFYVDVYDGSWHYGVYDIVTEAVFPNSCEAYSGCQGNENKVEICHVPSSGNPDTLCISQSSLDTHLGHHKDYCGPCISGNTGWKNTTISLSSYQMIDGFRFRFHEQASSDSKQSWIDDVNITCAGPVCGNGVLEQGEECDDGNTVSGDGCSSTCTLETLQCNPQVELVSNGGFESPIVTNPEGWDIFSNGTPYLVWNVAWQSNQTTYNGVTRPQLAQLELQRSVNGWLPNEGAQWAELDTDWDGPGGSLSGEPATVKIFRDVRTIPGKTYSLSFSFSPRPNTNISENVLEVRWDNVVQATISKAGSSNTNWTRYAYNFTATNDVTRLQFADLGIPDSLGVFFDNVSLKCITPVQPAACNLTFDKTSPQVYGTPITATCRCTPNSGTVKLYRNGTDVTSENGSAVTLGAGTYGYVCNTTGNANYTNATNSSTFVINKANNPVTLLLNGVAGNLILTYGQTSNATAFGVGATLYRNNTLVSNPEIAALGVGTYVYFANATGNANYSANTTGVNFNLTIVTIQPAAAVRPILECVDLLQNGSYVAHFGYQNDNNITVNIPISGVSPFNKITGGGLAGINQGQPIAFFPGRTPYYPNNSFNVVFDGTNLVWTLTGPDNSTRTSTASNSSTKCDSIPPTILTYNIVPRSIYVNETSSVEVTVIDNIGVKRVWAVFSGPDVETVTIGHQTGNNYIGTFDPLIDGVFHVVIYAEDFAGNIVSVNAGQVLVNELPTPPGQINCMNITSFGLVTQPAIIGVDKVRAFLVTDYFCAKTILGLWEYDFYLEIKELDGTPLLIDGQPIVYGKYPPAGADVDVYVINRLALWKNEYGAYNPVILSLGVWR